MQFNQCGPYPPQCLYGQFNGYLPPQSPTCNQTPEVVGEGDVVTIMNLDGSMQFYFVPVLSYPCGFRSMTTPCVNPCGAWLIKSISNPVATTLNQQGAAYLRRCPPMPIPEVQPTFMPDIYPHSSGQIKFHYDGCTSTSDIHYFYPILRTCEWIPPVPASPQQTPAPPQFTCPDACPEPVRPNVDRPPCECMCVDQPPIKRNKEENLTLSPSSSSNLSSTKKKKKKNTNTCDKKVKITSSKSSGSLRSLVDKIKCKKKKPKVTNKSSSKCCSNCECTRRATKRKAVEKKDSTCQSSSSGLGGWGTRKTKKNKQEPAIKKETKEQKQTKKQEKLTMEVDKETKEETTISTKLSKSSYSLKSLLDILKRKIGGLVCTPSSCGETKESRVDFHKSGMTEENKMDQSATGANTPIASVVSLKSILAKISMKCKKNEKQSETTDKETSTTGRAPSVRVIYDRESNSLQSTKRSDRSISFERTLSSSKLTKMIPQHCGCDTCIRCSCKQKAPDCQCSKQSVEVNRNIDHCTCNEGKNRPTTAMDCQCYKVNEKPLNQLNCTCNEGQNSKRCQCTKDNELEMDIQEVASDCKCTANQKVFNCKCHKDMEDTASKSRNFLEKKRSNLKTLKPAQTASGDNRKRGQYVCGCAQDSSDDINCDEQCRYKNSSKKIIEDKKQADCGCDKDGADDMDCDEQCRFISGLGEVKEKKTRVETVCSNGKKCVCDQEEDNKKCKINCRNKGNILLHDDTDEGMVMESDTIEKTKEGGNQMPTRYDCGCDRDTDNKSCDLSCKSKREIILELDLPQGRVEQTIAMIDPDDRFSDSESVLMSSGSSAATYCSCRPNRCKYSARTDSTCSCDSQL